MKKGIKVFLGLGCGVVVFLGVVIIGTVVFVWIKEPESRIVPGDEMSAAHMKIIDDLDLLKGNEKILYFYSDALVNIKDSMYLLTDQNLILCSNIWEKPLKRIPFHQIAGVEFHRDENFLTDSSVSLDLFSDDQLWFQISSENGTDILFVERLNELRRAAGIVDDPAE